MRIDLLIEYNVRMGDPECQTILPKLKTNLGGILMACCEGRLDKLEINWLNKKSLCVVVCSKGYPEDFNKNIEIENINKVNLTMLKKKLQRTFLVKKISHFEVLK